MEIGLEPKVNNIDVKPVGKKYEINFGDEVWIYLGGRKELTELRDKINDILMREDKNMNKCKECPFRYIDYRKNWKCRLNNKIVNAYGCEKDLSEFVVHRVKQDYIDEVNKAGGFDIDCPTGKIKK